ncbi:capsid assembly protein [Elioraea thermophila]|uniref:capsid assembly protein n=1 Tax=Elioraea thermophila TaxID=2185104 RepID=UPI000DF30060|nr:hypothetical protein [Elioraea thermophila]
MADNLIEMTLDNAKPEPAEPKRGKPCPPEVPEKFWDEEKGEVRLDALLKSYRELERKLSRMVSLPGDDSDEEERRRFLRALGVPESPEEYHIEPRHPLVTADPDVNRRLHEAGFTPAQVQLVYDLAAERLLPLIAEAAQIFEAERQIERLKDHFGGEERWQRAAKQLAAWGKANLPEAVFDALSSTYEGVLAMQKMMEKNEPGILKDAEAARAMNEDDLRALMRDPRYWRRRDPAIVERVTEGFRRLYPEER